MNKGDKYKVIDFDCGHKAQSRLMTMGIIKDSILEIMAIQPQGPYTVKVGKSEYTIGRGLFAKIILEKIE